MEKILQIRLKAGREKRALGGHPWIFAGETEPVPAASIQPGDLIDLVTASGRPLGRGMINPNSQILIRLLDRGAPPIDEGFFAQRLRRALEYRRRIGYQPSCTRVVSSEADGLPGLIVDRYEDCLVMQALTQGMHRRLAMIQSALADVLQPRAIYLKNDSPILEREGLPLEKRVLAGPWPEPWEFELDDLRLSLDIETVQKTGLFLDQTVNRRRLAGSIAGKSVLDVFCYVGLWSLSAARAGASRVLGIDSSAEAVARAAEHAKRNRLSNPCRFERRVAFDALESLAAGSERFDAVILDPPAFVKSKTKLKPALRGYEKLNRLGLEVLARPGLLVTSSCSYQVSNEAFLDAVRRAAQKTGREARLLHFFTQAPDHPVLLQVPETQYLKCAYLWVE